MTRLALFAILFVLVAGTVWAQQVPHAPLGTTPAESATESPSLPRDESAETSPDARGPVYGPQAVRRGHQGVPGRFDRRFHNAKALNSLGMAFQQIGNGDQAEHYYKLASRADKTDSNALNNLGTVEYSEQRYGKAISIIAKPLPRETRLRRCTAISAMPIAASRNT